MKNMQNMFQGATKFNSPLSGWDVGNVTGMTNMFQGASGFNQSLVNWCVIQISSVPSNFSTNSPLSSGNSPHW